MTQISNNHDLERRRQEWIERVRSLVAQIAEWAQSQGWIATTEDKTLHERLLGDYTVQSLVVRLPGGELLVNPIGLHIVGGDGRVDLEGFPTLSRVKLIGGQNGWQIMTDSNVPLREPWSLETFIQLAHDLLA